MATERSEPVEVGDGSFGAFLAVPEGGAGPGVLLLHEIFGIADFAQGKARDLAGAGYVVLVPDLFWRLEPGFVAPDTEDENSFHPMFWNPDATAASWRHTLEFLARSLEG